MSLKDRMRHGETNVGYGMVPPKKPTKKQLDALLPRNSSMTSQAEQAIDYFRCRCIELEERMKEYESRGIRPQTMARLGKLWYVSHLFALGDGCGWDAIISSYADEDDEDHDGFGTTADEAINDAADRAGCKRESEK